MHAQGTCKSWSYTLLLPMDRYPTTEEAACCVSAWLIAITSPFRAYWVWEILPCLFVKCDVTIAVTPDADPLRRRLPTALCISPCSGLTSLQFIYLVSYYIHVPIWHLKAATEGTPGTATSREVRIGVLCGQTGLALTHSKRSVFMCKEKVSRDCWIL